MAERDKMSQLAPGQKRARPRKDTAGDKARQEAHGGDGGQPARVLIVEDEPSLRALYRAELAKAGYEVEALKNGEQALARFAHSPRPDAIIMDTCLRGMDGIEVMRQLLANDPDIRVILHSAYPMHKRDFATWCADAYIVKSTDRRPLLQSLAHVLKSAGGQREKAG